MILLFDVLYGNLKLFLVDKLQWTEYLANDEPLQGGIVYRERNARFA